MTLVVSYSTLQTAVGEWLARGDLTSFIPNFVQNWEERFYRQPMNFGRWMESALSGTIASSILAIPADYLELKYAYINGSPSSRLDRMSLNQCYGRFPRGGATGIPQFIARDATSFVFGPEPDSNYTVKGVYFAKPTLMRSFAADAAAHWLIVNAPDLVLYGSLCESAPFLRKDERLPVWQGLYGQALQDYRDLHHEEDVSGSPIQEVLG